MKKLIALGLAAAMTMSMAVSASALTPIKWDMEAIQDSVDAAVEKALQNREFEIIYDLNGGFAWNIYTSPAFKTELCYTDTGTHTVVDVKPTRTMYKLVGWEYEGEILQPGDIIALTENVTLTAVWENG